MCQIKVLVEFPECGSTAQLKPVTAHGFLHPCWLQVPLLSDFWAQSLSETYLCCPKSPRDASLTTAGSQAHMFRLALIAEDKLNRYK